MSKRKPKPWSIETEILMEFIYENELYEDFEQFNKYHFRLKGKLDVWPGSKKFYIRGTGKSATYQDVNELKNFL